MRKAPSGRRALAAILALFIVIAFVRAWQFYWFPGLPGLYAKDLGVNYIVTENIRHAIHSLRDFIDMLGWSAWSDQPFFFFNPYTPYVLTVPLADLLTDTWASIKLLEIAQTLAACLGTYWLMRLFSRPRVWALAAGVTYAAIPAVILMPRGNLDLGWPTTLAPACIAAGIALLRRFGPRALPLCGILCSLIGFCTAIEYVLFVSAPIFAILCGYAARRRRLSTWLPFAAVGFVVMVSFGAYYVVPTLQNHIFSDSAVRTETLANGVWLPDYSENFISAAALILREALLSPVALYNATPQVPIAMIGGVALWLLALVGISANYRVFRAPFGIVSVSIIGILLFLSASALLPGGAALWHALGRLPLLDAVRTPDRFVTLPMLAVVILAIEGLRTVVEQAPGQRYTAPLVLAVVFSAFYYVASAQQVWTNQQDYGFEEPALNTVNQLVARIGPRTAALALLNGGSTGDYPSYGVPTPTFTALWELASRYAQDGIAMTGILPRLSTKSVITTPNWAGSDNDNYPDFGIVFGGQKNAHLIFRSDENVRVYALAADPEVVSTRVACLRGGPGLLDDLLALPEFRRVDFSATASSCSLDALSNRDREDELALGRANWSAAGATLCPQCDRARDADFLFYPGRVLLNQPWYRNSIDGDGPLFDDRGAAILRDDTTIVMRPGSYHSTYLRLRIASHAFATLRFSCNGRESSVRLIPFKGFRWIDAPSGITQQCASVAMNVAVDPTLPANLQTFAGAVALDGVAAVSERDASDSRVTPPTIVAFATDHFGSTTDPTFIAQTKREREPDRELNITWHGQAASVAVVARVIGSSESSSTQISAGATHAKVFSHRANDNDESGPKFTMVVARLHEGDRINASAKGSARVARLDAVALNGRLSLFEASNALVSGDVDFQNAAASLAQAKTMSGFDVNALSSRGLTGRTNSLFETTLPAIPDASSIVVGFLGLAGSGSASTSLVCGTRHAQQYISADSKEGLELRPNSSPCTFRMVWKRSLTVGAIFFNITRSTIAGVRSAWIPRGTYRVGLYAKGLNPIALSSVSIDGRSVRKDAALSFAADGPHRLTLRGTPASSAFILFEPTPLAGVSDSSLTFQKTASLRYSVTVANKTDVKISHLSDGNWIFKGDKGSVYPGFACDLLATCYRDVVPGSYRLFHRIPRPVLTGFALTALSLLVALCSLLIPNARWLAHE